MALEHGWKFPKEFGFTESAKGNDNARSHAQNLNDDEAGNETYVERRRGGRVHKADGGDIKQETLSAPGTSFKAAFAAARKQALNGGPKTFTWQGKSYNTNLATDKQATAAPAKSYPTVTDDSTYYPSDKNGQDIATGTIDHLQDSSKPAMGGHMTGEYRRGGRVHKAMGGAMPTAPGPAPGPVGAAGPSPDPMSAATISIPVPAAKKMAQGLMQVGHKIGSQQTILGLANAARARMGGAGGMAPPAAARAPISAPQPARTPGVPAMAKGGFIKDAIHHPGRMKEGAAREGVSTHKYMEEHKHSPGSLGAAARMGLRLTGGDLSPRRKK